VRAKLPTKTTNPKKMMSAKPLVLVDGSSYVYRAFHALPALSNSAGEPTGAIHGVLNMLQRLIDDYDPDDIAVVFDAPGKTFRDDLYADYKANRPPMPDELRSQLQPISDAIEALGIPVLRVAGVEADDVIGTIARQARKAGRATIISTTDKDMAQLVDEHTTVVNTMSNTELDSTGVKEKFGVLPGQIVDYLTLVGDSSDNIPGVSGVGPKTAVKWLEQHGDLKTLVEHSGKIAGKVGETLRATLEALPLFQELVTIKCDVDLPLGIDELRRKAPDRSALRALFEKFEMRTMLRRLGAADPESEQLSEPTDRSYETILSEPRLDSWLAKIEGAELVAIDTETTSLDYMRARLVGISLSVQAGEAAYIPLAHDYAGAPEQLPLEHVLERMQAWLESPEHAKLGHHIKYDAHIFANHGIELAGIEYDSMLESYILNSTATRHDMDSVASRYLGLATVKYEDVAGKGAKQIGFNEVEVDVAGRYAAEDADVTLRLHEALWPQIAAIPELERLYVEIEQPLVRVLGAMERTGVMVDSTMLAEQSRELELAMQEAEQAAHEAAGGPFNLSSPKQLQEILYDRLGLPVLGKTPTGQPSTAESVLQDLAEEYDLPRSILRFRALSKLKSTYTDKLPREINPETGRIHTSYHQAVAATGRLSSSEPNLQNIPIRTPEGRRIRQAFVAPRGYQLLAADYSQIELRIMAHLSHDEGLLAAFADQRDIHRATAAEVFGATAAEVTDDQRRSAKAINFGLIYGMSAFGLARQLGITRAEAQTYVDLYFERYPGVKRYMDETRTLARERGYVSTVKGRRLYLPEINSRNAQRRQYAERSAINAPMQGTAADIIKRAMIDVDAWLATAEIDGRLIMQVHDELVLEVAETDVDIAKERVATIMESAETLAAPLRVDVGTGANWDEAH
jgi:DNA polymerase-1